MLDGVRGIAIALVLLVHFTPDYLMPTRGLEWAKKLLFTGWIGVDLFFVLSGMLITDILIRSKGPPGAAWVFYTRRFLRIMPLYLGTLTVTFGVLPWFIATGTDPRFDTMRATQGWYWAHCANVLAYLHGSPAMTSSTVNLTHLWSLAVEEHFYLVWPLVVWTVPERKLLWVAGGLILAAVALRLAVPVVLQLDHRAGLFVQTPLRMDALAVGGVVTLLFRRVQAQHLRRAACVILPLTAVVIGWDFFARKGLWSTGPFVTGIGLTAIAIMLGSIIVILRTVDPRGSVVRLADNLLLRLLGRYSYGVYILRGVLTPTLDRWFSKDQALAELGSPVLATVFVVAAKSGVSVGAALVSWHLLEAPCLRLKQYFEFAPANTRVASHAL